MPSTQAIAISPALIMTLIGSLVFFLLEVFYHGGDDSLPLVSRDPAASSGTMLWRALTRRCPRCGAKAFDGYYHLKEHCSSCGVLFEREEGYWAGALIINTIVTFGLLLITLLAKIHQCLQK